MFWQKVWIWLKSYWFIPLILILVIFASIFFRKGNFALDLLNNAIESYRRQISEIERLNAEKEKQKEELQRKYELAIKLLEEKYSKDSQDLLEERKKLVKELLDTYKDDEEGLAKQFAKEFGLKLQ